MRVESIVAVSIVAVVASASLAYAQRAVQVSPDGENLLINKPQGGQEWSIGVDFAAQTILGNVFNFDGSNPQFVYCTIVSPHIVSSADLHGQAILIECKVADGCPAFPCTPANWTDLGMVSVDGAFFVPPGSLCGNGVIDSGAGEVCDPPGQQSQCASGQVCRSCTSCEGSSAGSVCGNGIVESGEVCDPPDQQSQCASGQVCQGCASCEGNASTCLDWGGVVSATCDIEDPAPGAQPPLCGLSVTLINFCTQPLRATGTFTNTCLSALNRTFDAIIPGGGTAPGFVTVSGKTAIIEGSSSMSDATVRCGGDPNAATFNIAVTVDGKTEDCGGQGPTVQCCAAPNNPTHSIDACSDITRK